MIKLNKNELEFLRIEKVARVSTMSEKGWPQTTPVLFVFHDGYIYFATDSNTKKFQNLKVSRKISIVIDVYGRKVMGVTFQGNAEMLEGGSEFNAVLKKFTENHEYYRKNPFKEGEAAIVKIVPSTKASWGL